MSDILCKDCIESDPSETNSYGTKIHCGWYKMYVDPYDTCRHAARRGYYVSTAICQILGYDEENEVQSTIVNFSKNILQKEKNTMELVKEYDKVGPLLARALFTDNDKELCGKIYANYLVPVSDFVKNNQYANAINLYKNMVVSLQDYYGYSNENEKQNEVCYNNEPKETVKTLTKTINTKKR